MKLFLSKSLFVLMGVTFLAGCGQSVYESRLAESKGYYAHVYEMESSLGKKWKSKGDITGIEIRPPKGFKKISAPKQEVDEEGNILSEEDDKRQPYHIAGFYDGELPGLVGAWKKKVKVDVGDSDQDFNMYMYVLARQTSGLGDDEISFGDQVYSQLVVDLNIDEEADGENDWGTKTLPISKKYTEKIIYDDLILTPGNSVGGLMGKSVEFRLYQYEKSGKEIVLLFINPEGGMSRNDGREYEGGLKHCLQSLKVRRGNSSVSISNEVEDDAEEESSKPRKKKSSGKKSGSGPAF